MPRFWSCKLCVTKERANSLGLVKFFPFFKNNFLLIFFKILNFTLLLQVNSSGPKKRRPPCRTTYSVLMKTTAILGLHLLASSLFYISFFSFSLSFPSPSLPSLPLFPVLSPFFDVTLYAVHRDNKSAIDEFLTKCGTSPAATKGMLGYLANHVYFIHCARALSPQEMKVSEGIVNSPLLAKIHPVSAKLTKSLVSW